jgi:hypothetical protein
VYVAGYRVQGRAMPTAGRPPRQGPRDTTLIIRATARRRRRAWVIAALLLRFFQSLPGRELVMLDRT